MRVIPVRRGFRAGAAGIAARPAGGSVGFRIAAGLAGGFLFVRGVGFFAVAGFHIAAGLAIGLVPGFAAAGFFAGLFVRAGGLFAGVIAVLFVGLGRILGDVFVARTGVTVFPGRGAGLNTVFFIGKNFLVPAVGVDDDPGVVFSVIGNLAVICRFG